MTRYELVGLEYAAIMWALGLSLVMGWPSLVFGGSSNLSYPGVRQS